MPRSLLAMTCALLLAPACSTPAPDTAALATQIAQLEGAIAALEVTTQKIPSLEMQLGQLEAARRSESLYAWDGAGTMIGRVLVYDKWSPVLMVPGVPHPVITHVFNPGEWDSAWGNSPTTRDGRLGLEYTQEDCAGTTYAYGGKQLDIGGKMIGSDQPAYLLNGLVYDWQEFTGVVEIRSNRSSPWKACRSLIPYDESRLRFTYQPTGEVYTTGVVVGVLP